MGLVSKDPVAVFLLCDDAGATAAAAGAAEPVKTSSSVPGVSSGDEYKPWRKFAMTLLLFVFDLRFSGDKAVDLRIPADTPGLEVLLVRFSVRSGGAGDFLAFP